MADYLPFNNTVNNSGLQMLGSAGDPMYPTINGLQPQDNNSMASLNLQAPLMYSDGTMQGDAGTQTQQVDPYARWGGQAGYNQQRGAYDTSLANYGVYGQQRPQQSADAYKNSAQQDLWGYQDAQKNLNQSAGNITLNKMLGAQDVNRFVGQGIQGGMSRLSGMNSLDSSATGAMARAFSNLGNQRMRNIGNQEAQANAKLGLDQEALQTQMQRAQITREQTKKDYTTQIESDVRNQVQTLKAQAQGLSLPDQLDVQTEINRIVQDAQAKLGGVDQWFAQQQQAGPQQLNPEQRMTQANTMQQAGTAVQNPFDYGNQGGGNIYTQGSPTGEAQLGTQKRKDLFGY